MAVKFLDKKVPKKKTLYKPPTDLSGTSSISVLLHDIDPHMLRVQIELLRKWMDAPEHGIEAGSELMKVVEGNARLAVNCLLHSFVLFEDEYEEVYGSDDGVPALNALKMITSVSDLNNSTNAMLNKNGEKGGLVGEHTKEILLNKGKATDEELKVFFGLGSFTKEMEALEKKLMEGSGLKEAKGFFKLPPADDSPTIYEGHYEAPDDGYSPINAVTMPKSNVLKKAYNSYMQGTPQNSIVNCDFSKAEDKVAAMVLPGETVMPAGAIGKSMKKNFNSGVWGEMTKDIPGKFFGKGEVSKVDFATGGTLKFGDSLYAKVIMGSSSDDFHHDEGLYDTLDNGVLKELEELYPPPIYKVDPMTGEVTKLDDVEGMTPEDEKAELESMDELAKMVSPQKTYSVNDKGDVVYSELKVVEDAYTSQVEEILGEQVTAVSLQKAVDFLGLDMGGKDIQEYFALMVTKLHGANLNFNTKNVAKRLIDLYTENLLKGKAGKSIAFSEVTLQKLQEWCGLSKATMGKALSIAMTKDLTVDLLKEICALFQVYFEKGYLEHLLKLGLDKLTLVRLLLAHKYNMAKGSEFMPIEIPRLKLKKKGVK